MKTNHYNREALSKRKIFISIKALKAEFIGINEYFSNAEIGEKTSFARASRGIVLCCLIILMGPIQAFAKGQQDPASLSKEEGSTLVFANFRDIRDLNPHLYGGELFAQHLLFETLVKIENDGSISPWLAKSYRISEDGLTYSFTLREDVYFHDGVPFNAETAKANFDAVLDNAERHGWLESVILMQAVDAQGGTSVEALSEFELVLRLSEPYYPFLVELGMTRPFCFISPDSFIEGTTKKGVARYSGTGPYILQENHTDEYSVFIANEHYWGNPAAIHRIIAKVIPDGQTRSIALENGEIDLIYGTNLVSSETYNFFQSLDGFSAVLSEPVATRTLVFNTADEITGDVRVRRAIAHATDKNTISAGFFDGMESPADTLLAPSVPYADIGLEPYEWDLVKAETLLEDAGWKKVPGSPYRQKDGKDLDIVLNYTSDNVTDKSIAEFMQGELAKIGINLTIKGEEEQSYRDHLYAGDFQFTFDLSWGTPYDPHSYLAAMRKPVNGDYFAQLGLKNKKELDQNILDALKSTDEGDRQDHYTYVLKTLHEEAVYIPLTYERNRAVFNEKVTNVLFNPSKFEVPMEKMRIQ